MADTCRRLDLKLTQKELDEFYRLQWGYFVRAVADGESITYRDKEIPPYDSAIPSPSTPCPRSVRGSRHRQFHRRPHQSVITQGSGSSISAMTI
jgi:hypothetical protein